MAFVNRPYPSLDRETTLWRQGFRAVAGVDEVGRGPLAGPVVAAAVIVPVDFAADRLAGVRDSKLLSARQLLRLDRLIRDELPAVALGSADQEEIDRLNIAGATRLAMLRAVVSLPTVPDFVLLDGRERLALSVAQMSVVDGDALCLSIAAASIVAKVHRDNLMTEMDRTWPGWGFAQHKGYPTVQHRSRLAALGPLPIHRRSFGPVRRALEQGQG